jgi:hypothetical protein
MKFSIRDLFLVTVIVAVCVAWWLDHRAGKARDASAKGIMQSMELSYQERVDNLSRDKERAYGKFESLAWFMDREGYKVYLDGEYGMTVLRPGEPETIFQKGLNRIREESPNPSAPAPIPPKD